MEPQRCICESYYSWLCTNVGGHLAVVSVSRTLIVTSIIVERSCRLVFIGEPADN